MKIKVLDLRSYYANGDHKSSIEVRIFMDKTYDLEIIPGVRVGRFHLGSDLDTLLQQIEFDYTLEKRDDYTFIFSENFWFHHNDNVGLYSIYARGKFMGKYKGISIGTVLADLKSELNYEIDEDYLQETMWWRFHLPDEPGIHFVPVKEWDDRTPVNFISVFLPQLINKTS